MTENIDLFIYYLQRHLELLDTEIAAISARIAESNDPEGDGYYDSAEYFMGAGLVAVQKYMTETFLSKGVEQATALNVGPKLTGEVSFAWVVWAAANYWKHDAEWWGGAVELGPQDSDGMSPIKISWPEGGKSTKNVSVLKEFGGFGDYICSNILAALADETEDVRLQSVLPYLKAWRGAIE